MADIKKTAIITGANSGIGEAIVHTLSDAGWNVVGLTRDDCDLSDLKATAELVEKLRQEVPVIDVLIHAAGVYHSQNETQYHRDLEDYDPEWIAATMNVSVTSFMVLAGGLLPNMAKDGAVIGIGGTFEAGASGWLPYYTSKRALEDFLTGLAEDYKSGPRVYGISPFDTTDAAENVSLLVDHLISGESPYHSGDIIVVKHKKAAKGFHI